MRVAAWAREGLALLLLVPVVLLVHGYHPWSDDAAIYIAGLREMIHPWLYANDAAFVLSHTKVSVFSHVLAIVAEGFHLRVEWLVLASYLISAWLFLYASRRLATRLFQDERASWFATLIAAACFTMPVAGTAIFVMDPYLTARSFSTPFSILAVVGVLDRKWKSAGFWIVMTGLMHPQMGAYLAGFVTILALVDRGRIRTAIGVSVGAILGCAVIWLATLHAPVTAAARVAVLSRTYFFPSLWHWYEWVGLAAPLLLMAVAWAKCEKGSAARNICATSVLVGTAACIAAFSLVHPQGPYFLARVQLLRSFQLIYVLGVVLLGGFLGKTVVQRYRWTGVALFAAAAMGMFVASLQMYPGSTHLELPGTTPENPWGQALNWIRVNTPRNAMFAISPTLLYNPAEDLPGFRAMAERSVLVDNKDEGVASIFPDVAGEWMRRANAEAGLDQMSEAERVARLKPFGVSWLLLPPAVAKSLSCPYSNSEVSVCRLTQ